ncbi:MAG TPA: ABC transporter permease [Candidatus Acidoferrales bacterium]|nr:ABC transporter permease [Candidatus Acidoferrales bacterium]
MNTLVQDVRFAVRMLWKHRWVTLLAIAALALGIGTNTAIFSLAEAFLVRPVPFEHAESLVAIVDTRPELNIDRNSVAPATYFDWKEQSRSFQQMAAYEWDEVNLTGDGEPQKVQGMDVSSNFFNFLQVQPILGRTFLPEEEQSGKDQEIILGYGLWERRYASDPHIVGKTVKVDGRGFTIVGVMGKGFDFPQPAEVWLPLAFQPKDKANRATRGVWVLGRLHPNISIKQAGSEMRTIETRLSEAYPDTSRGWHVRVMPIAEFATGALTRQYTILLMGAVGFVLLIACANVANVQFARVTGRQRELAIRAALGASRGRIVRQLLTESVLLSAGGAAVGLLFANASLELILANMPPDIARFIAGWKTIQLDAGAFLFTLAIALVSGVLSGLGPAVLSSRAKLNETLKESGRSSSGRGRHRMRSTLVVAEISLALVLLLGAGLLVKGFRALLTVNNSFSPETLLTFKVSLPELQYKEAHARAAFFDKTLERLSAIPNVQSAAIASYAPYEGGGGTPWSIFSIEGRPTMERGEQRLAITQTISPGFIRLINISLLDGRELSDADGQDTLPVALVSESMVRRYFPGENPLGKRIKAGRNDSDNPWMTIVGVVSDIHYGWLDKEYVPTLYRPYRQTPRSYTTLFMRTSASPSQFVSAARSQITALDAELPIFDVKPLDILISESVVGIAYVAVMMAVLGVIALVLASVGVYGVMSYSVGERNHEIGIRMALGARTRDILRLILKNGMLITLLGVGIGLPISFALARALSSLLFGVESTDLAAFVGLPLLLSAVAALACYIPARRASRVDPLVALRYE